MSYYTQFNLSAGPFPPEFSDEDKRRLEFELKKIDVFDDFVVDKDYCEANAFEKWYESDDDMLLLSARFPGLLFTLRGAGENTDDMWVSYYLGGRVQHGCAHIEYDDFDPSKLKPGKVLDTGQPYSSHQYDSL